MRAALSDFVRQAIPECTTLEAADGAGALRSCIEHRPDLVLMDIHLPDASGIELTGRIKAALPAIVVIFVSYLSNMIHVEEALAAGAFGYVVKDKISTELLPLIERALGGGPNEIEGS